jgi:hypothetical protein
VDNGAKGSFGRWMYAMVRDPGERGALLEAAVGEMEATA